MTGFFSCHKTDKKFKSLYGFGERCLNIRDVCMDFEPCFNVHNLVSAHPKSIKLGQMRFIDYSPQFPVHIVSPIFRAN